MASSIALDSVMRSVTAARNPSSVNVSCHGSAIGEEARVLGGSTARYVLREPDVVVAELLDGLRKRPDLTRVAEIRQVASEAHRARFRD